RPEEETLYPLWKRSKITAEITTGGRNVISAVEAVENHSGNNDQRKKRYIRCGIGRKPQRK
ncbi:MAG: hypothetical protein IKG66_00470, partial [Lachnospiraceae bacterium]|nr:hypothetical protein [Lachnospiraceae bacterium]